MDEGRKQKGSERPERQGILQGCRHHRELYFYWQRKVREAANGQTVGRKEGNRLINPAANGFAEVRLLEQPERAVPRDAKTPSVIRVEGHGLQIVADENYPVAKLSELLRCLVRL